MRVIPLLIHLGQMKANGQETRAAGDTKARLWTRVHVSPAVHTQPSDGKDSCQFTDDEGTGCRSPKVNGGSCICSVFEDFCPESVGVSTSHQHHFTANIHSLHLEIYRIQNHNQVLNKQFNFKSNIFYQIFCVGLTWLVLQTYFKCFSSKTYILILNTYKKHFNLLI